MNLIRQSLSLLLPITVLIIVPLLIEHDLTLSPPLFFSIGLTFILLGLFIMAITVRMFILIGNGTLAPWDQTKKLMTGGLYGHVRNPLITGVMTILLGESLIFHSSNIFLWLVIFFITNNIYFVLYEEPGLERRFGEEYLEYKKNVPRWMPRMRPWVK